MDSPYTAPPKLPDPPQPPLDSGEDSKVDAALSQLGKAFSNNTAGDGPPKDSEEIKSKEDMAEVKVAAAKTEVAVAEGKVAAAETSGCSSFQMKMAEKAWESAQKGLESAQKWLESAQKALESANEGVASAQTILTAASGALAALMTGETTDVAGIKAEISGVKRRLGEVEAVQALKHPALALFNPPKCCGSRSSHNSFGFETNPPKLTEAQRKQIKDAFGDCCAICRRPRAELENDGKGNSIPLTLAHIVPGNPKKLNKYGATREGVDSLSKGFREQFDFHSVRNFIPLCGTDSQEGTCHWAFDSLLFGLLYSPLRSSFQLYWHEPGSRTDGKNELDENHSRAFHAPASWNPFKRGLTFHFLAGLDRRHEVNEKFVDLVNVSLVSLQNPASRAQSTADSTETVSSSPARHIKLRRSCPVSSDSGSNS